jgi:hypothetical protein
MIAGVITGVIAFTVFACCLLARGISPPRARRDYYVVSAGRGRGTHIMLSAGPATPNPRSLDGAAAQIVWFGGSAKPTLCGLPAAQRMNGLSPAGASCRECRRRWRQDTTP